MKIELTWNTNYFLIILKGVKVELKGNNLANKAFSALHLVNCIDNSRKISLTLICFDMDNCTKKNSSNDYFFVPDYFQI